MDSDDLGQLPSYPANGEPTFKPREDNEMKIVVSTVIGLVIGLTVGLGLPADPEVRTATSTKVVYRTPPSCIEALDMAGDVFGISAEVLRTTVEGYSSRDLAVIRDATREIRLRTEELRDMSDRMGEVASDCRSRAYSDNRSEG